MIVQSFYHPTLGVWHHTADRMTPENMHRLPEGTIEIPLPPSPNHRWDGVRWVPPTKEELYELAATSVRSRRDFLLRSKVDIITSNPLRWSDMSQQKKDEWAAYRKALLNITEQKGFPHTVAWPTEPS